MSLFITVNDLKNNFVEKVSILQGPTGIKVLQQVSHTTATTRNPHSYTVVILH